ncbi:hypothetical protein ABEB36_010223 [Hypothenemus hampei]|uniref:Sjoegren syndrome nuclear autoantigen 1 n=1 Tax=Hypothenemus hampei TaxID=57062 RepID=A0ABD1EJD7_HYPHA
MHCLIMTEHGALLQTCNQELVKCLEELKIKRNQLFNVIKQEEYDKRVLEKNVNMLQDKLSKLSQDLEYHKQIFDDYDRAITDTEMGFQKILESSQTLLKIAQTEAYKLEGNEK